MCFKLLLENKRVDTNGMIGHVGYAPTFSMTSYSMALMTSYWAFIS